MTRSFLILYFSFLLFTACTSKKANIITYDLKRCDYIETIRTEGTVQAVNSLSVMVPRISSNSITIVHLLKEGTKVSKGDVICELEAADLRTIIESFTTEMERMEAEMRKLEANNAMEISMLNAQIATNNAQLAMTMLDSVQMKFAPPVKQKLLKLEMEKATIEKNKLRKKLAAQRRINMTEIMQLKSRISMQKNRIESFQNQVNSLTLVSPGEGMVIYNELPGVMTFSGPQGMGRLESKIAEGGTTFPNMALFQIPATSQMQLTIDVPEIDFKRIKEGQRTNILVDAVNLHTTGKVKRKTLGGVNPRIRTTVKTYQVIVSIDSLHSKMKPGLSATCNIIIDEVKDTVVVPAGAIFDDDSLKIVYVEEEEKFKAVTVETGLSNSSKTIVSKGLKGDETIALMEPPHGSLQVAVGSWQSKSAVESRQSESAVDSGQRRTGK